MTTNLRAWLSVSLLLLLLGTAANLPAQEAGRMFNRNVGPRDWPQLGGSPSRNNVVPDTVPREWDFKSTRNPFGIVPGKNVKWAAKLGSQSYGTPIVANGRVYMGTNNGGGLTSDYSSQIDLGCLVSFDATDGKFVWQYSAHKLPTGRVHDWPLQGICSNPVVEGQRLWVVDNRGQVVCLDTEGFHDQEDNGPIQGEWAELHSWTHDLSKLDTPTARRELVVLVEASGLAWDWRFDIQPMETEGHWLVTDSRNKRQMYRIELGDGQLALFRIGPNVIGNPLRFNTNLLAGLDTGQLSPSLLLLLKQRELAVPAPYELHVLQAGSQWSLTASGAPAAGGLYLAVEGDQLRCRRRLTIDTPQHADVVWRFDMMNELGTRQHNMATCSPTIWGDLLFICTSNGVDESHINIPAPEAPSFLCLDKHTGEVIWTDNSPGKNILHGQWSSPAVGVFGGVPQVIFAGGDGYLRSFRADRGENGKPTLLWEFDANAKDTRWVLGGRGTRNNIVATPMVYLDRIYFPTGQDVEHGEGPATLYCLDPTRRGDVNAELLLGPDGQPAEHDRFEASSTRNATRQVQVVPNPNSAVMWKYQNADLNHNGEIEFEETMHRAIASPVIKNGLLIQVDFSGLVHCLDADTGKVHWTHDMLAACWFTPLIAGQHVYVSDEDGDVAIIPLSASREEALGDGLNRATEPIENNMHNSIYGAPTVANGVLYIATRTNLFAIGQ